MNNLKILILGAGRGLRMQPLTDNTPKPLLQLSQENILERLIKQINQSFVNFDLYVNISYLAIEVARFALKLPLEQRPRLVWEVTPSGTAVTLLKFASTIESSAILVIHGDLVLSNLGVRQLAESVYDYSSSIVFAHQRQRRHARSTLQTNGLDVKSIIENEESQTQIMGEDSVLVNSGIYYLRTEDLSQIKLPIEGTNISPYILNELICRGLLQYREWVWDRVSIDSHDAYHEGINLSINDPIWWLK